jgi:hypothetical protein
VQIQQGVSFFTIRFTDLVTTAAFVLAYWKYRTDRNHDDSERQRVRETTIQTDTARHTENKGKLETLEGFMREQLMLNKQRDIQINELRQQTVQLTEIAKYQGRRLEMLENRNC